jgi:hypothetical protein
MDIRHDQSDTVQALEGQRASGRVRVIVDILHGSQDSLA